jgi:hypothetical protein
MRRSDDVLQILTADLFANHGAHLPETLDASRKALRGLQQIENVSWSSEAVAKGEWKDHRRAGSSADTTFYVDPDLPRLG